MRAAKWTLIVIGGLLLLLAATVFVITSVIDPNRYRGRVEGIVADYAGRPFTIEGRLEVTWYPWLGLRMGAAHLADRAGVAGVPLIEWQSLSVAAKVIPLLKGELVVDRIRLEGPHIRLRRDAAGRGNWEGLGPMRRSGGAPSSSGLTKPPEVAGIEIRHGTLEYLDEASGLRLGLTNLELDMGEWRAGQPLPLHARFLVEGGSLPAKGVWVQMDSPSLAIRTQPLGVASSKLEVRVADARLAGNLTYEQTTDGHATANGSLAMHAPSVRKLAADLALNQTMPHDPTTLGPLELTTNWSYSDGALAAKPLALKLDGVTMQGWVEREAAPKSGWRFELHGDRIDLDRYTAVDSTSKEPFELRMLNGINANGSLIFDEARLADARLSGVRLRVETSASGVPP